MIAGFMLGVFATAALAGVLRGIQRPTLALPDPRDAWVQGVVRSCWSIGEYQDSTIHVARTRTGFVVCRDGASEYEQVSRARLVPTLRAHWDERLRECTAELAVRHG